MKLIVLMSVIVCFSIIYLFLPAGNFDVDKQLNYSEAFLYSVSTQSVLGLSFVSPVQPTAQWITASQTLITILAVLLYL